MIHTQQTNPPKTRAKGFTFISSAAFAVINTRAAAPSFSVLALAAVTVPVYRKLLPLHNLTKKKKKKGDK